MKNINPFPAWRYNTQKILDISQVLAPPYDVIGPNKRQVLVQASPYNVVQMDLPEAPEGLDKYAKAAEIFEAFKKEEVLKQEEKPALYVYFQTYTLKDGRTFTRKGFFARKRLEAFGEGSVKPHERTFEGPKADRFKLTQATKANLSPIFGLYSDPAGNSSELLAELAQGEPVLNLKWEGQKHQMWKIEDVEKINKLLNPIQNSSVLIADGHHRYETALNYREYRRQQLGEGATGEEAFEGVLMYLCPLSDPGLVVLPTHRVLAEVPPISEQKFRQALSSYGRLEDFSLEKVMDLIKVMESEELGSHAMGWIHGDRATLFVADLQKLTKSNTLNKLPNSLKILDVSILHSLIMEELLGLKQDWQREYGHIHYVKNLPDALRLTREKKSYGFLLKATPLEQMEAVCEAGETMPQKSTFFYPKLPTGLVFHDLG